MTTPGKPIPPEEMLPPRHRERFIDGGIGHLELLRERCDLQPGEDVLDLGCGPGRMAIALRSYMNADGSYEGFDVSEERIRWSNENIAAHDERFRFQVADVKNDFYRQNGEVEADEFRFPYESESFDLGMAFSLFTHMLPEGVERYLSEIARVLRPGGRCLMTFFLLNEISLDSIERDPNRKDLVARAFRARFAHDRGVYRVNDPDQPEAVVAYQEDFVRSAIERAGLSVADIAYGGWSGRTADQPHGQDVVVARRAGS